MHPHRTRSRARQANLLRGFRLRRKEYPPPLLAPLFSPLTLHCLGPVLPRNRHTRVYYFALSDYGARPHHNQPLTLFLLPRENAETLTSSPHEVCQGTQPGVSSCSRLLPRLCVPITRQFARCRPGQTSPRPAARNAISKNLPFEPSRSPGNLFLFFEEKLAFRQRPE